MLKSLGKYF